MIKECYLCPEVFDKHPNAKYCDECAKLVEQRVQKIGAETRKKKKQKKKYDSQYNNINHKKPKEEPASRLDRKSFWDNRDTSCDGCAYF